MLPSCKQVAEMLSDEMDSALPFYLKIKLKLHLWFCKNCRRYGKQLKIAAKTLQTLISKQSQVDEPRKQALKESLLQDYRQLYCDRKADCNCHQESTEKPKS